MNLSDVFIRRPVATTLIILGIASCSARWPTACCRVSDLPNVDFPTIQVNASLPGASPETMASAVALPLEKQFATIAGVTSISSSSFQGTHQHHAAVRPVAGTSTPPRRTCSRMIARAARSAAAADAGAAVVPEGQPDRLPGHDPRARVGHAAAVDAGRVRAVDDRAAPVDDQRRGPGQRDGLAEVRGADRRRSAGSWRPRASASTRWRPPFRTPTSTCRPASIQGAEQQYVVQTNGQLMRAAAFGPTIISYRNGTPVRLDEVAHVFDGVENDKIGELVERQAGHRDDGQQAAGQQHRGDRRRRHRRCCRASASSCRRR